MAYGVTSPANDWTQSAYIRAMTESKVAHTTLVTEQLSNHGLSCRKFAAGASATRATAYLYTDWSGAWPVSVRCLFRQELISSIAMCPWIFARTSFSSNVIDSTAYYGVTFDDSYVYLCGNASFADLLVYNSDCAVYGDISADAPRYDDWTGIRLDVWDEGDDVHLQVFCALGSSACDTLTSGEPVWEKYIDAYHISGSVTPTVLLGTAGSGFGSTTVNTTGQLGFGVGVPSVGGSTAMYVDSFRARRIA